MSDLQATVKETAAGFDVVGYESIRYDFSFLDGVFKTEHSQLADMYKKWGRCLAVADINVCDIYADQMEAYFKFHNIKLDLFRIKIGEQAKTMATALSIVDKMIEFGTIRKEPVLVVGGGLTTDVGGFATAMFRRTTNFIRIPTTLIGLIDAAVSIKVGINHGKHKNKLGAYHAPIHTFLDFTFLRTLPQAQIRNGFAELIKISTCADIRIFDLLDKYCEKLISTGFGRADEGDQEVRDAADEINRRGIKVMLELESPNLHELMLDRVIAFGHTISPTIELSPEGVPFRHGHAISIDMSYFSTLAWKRGVIPDADHKRILNLFSRAGLTMDSEYLNEKTLMEGIDAIHGVRDGKLRAAIPSPLGQCVFLNDVSKEEFIAAMHAHKEVCATYPRKGAGLEAWCDASDLGTKEQDEGEAMLLKKATEKAKIEGLGHGTTNGHSNGYTNGSTNGHTNGATNGHTNGNGIIDTIKQALPSVN